MQKGDHASNLVASEWFGDENVIKDSLKYSYDENGNIVSIKENGVEIVRYAYDGISRLVHEDNKKATSYMLINFYIKSVFSNTFLFLFDVFSIKIFSIFQTIWQILLLYITTIIMWIFIFFACFCMIF